MVNNALSGASQALVAALGTLIALFGAAVAEEKKWMEWVKQTVLTKQIQEADRRMDRALTALRMQVRTLKYSATQGMAEVADRVYAMLQTYGKVTRKPYEEQEGDVLTILEQLQSGGAYYNDASVLGITALVSELQNAFTLFRQLLKQRDEKELLKPETPFPEVRRNIEKIYYQIVDIIDAGARLNASPDYAAFINGLNPEIERLNGEFDPVRHDISDSEPAPIPPQQYTGRPLTPAPDVLYQTPHDGTVHLELGKDYNLAYRNNTEVGNAECIIRGKGKFRGSKTVTFIIVRAI
jgi:hypothetical protein